MITRKIIDENMVMYEILMKNAFAKQHALNSTIKNVFEEHTLIYYFENITLIIYYKSELLFEYLFNSKY